MGRACTVCVSENRVAIERALVQHNVPKTRLAAMYGLSVRAIDRHAINHVALARRNKDGTAQGLTEAAVGEIVNAETQHLHDLLERAKTGLERSEEALARAESTGAHKDVALASATYRGWLETACKLAIPGYGKPVNATQVNIGNTNDKTTRRLDVLSDVIAKYPELAREARDRLAEENLL